LNGLPGRVIHIGLDRFLYASFSEQDLPHQRQRQATLGDERVVKVAERSSFFGLVVVPELLDL